MWRHRGTFISLSMQFGLGPCLRPLPLVSFSLCLENTCMHKFLFPRFLENPLVHAYLKKGIWIITIQYILLESVWHHRAVTNWQRWPSKQEVKTLAGNEFRLYFCLVQILLRANVILHNLQIKKISSGSNKGIEETLIAIILTEDLTWRLACSWPKVQILLSQLLSKKHQQQLITSLLDLWNT